MEVRDTHTTMAMIFGVVAVHEIFGAALNLKATAAIDVWWTFCIEELAFSKE